MKCPKHLWEPEVGFAPTSCELITRVSKEFPQFCSSSLIIWRNFTNEEKVNLVWLWKCGNSLHYSGLVLLVKFVALLRMELLLIYIGETGLQGWAYPPRRYRRLWYLPIASVTGVPAVCSVLFYMSDNFTPVHPAKQWGLLFSLIATLFWSVCVYLIRQHRFDMPTFETYPQYSVVGGAPVPDRCTRYSVVFCLLIR